MVKQQCIMVIWSSASTCNGDTTLAITAINNLFSDIKGFHKEKLVIQGKIWKQSELEMFLSKKIFGPNAVDSVKEERHYAGSKRAKNGILVKTSDYSL